MLEQDNLAELSKQELSAIARAQIHLNAEGDRLKINDLKPPFFYFVPTYSDAFKEHFLKYILLSSGRGSAKSFCVTQFLIEQSFLSVNKDSIFIFGREIQGSIEDSCYAMTKSLIQQAQLEDFFKITNNRITNTITGVTFVYMGFRATGGRTAASQINKIKGKFNIKFIFVDEAQDMSEDVINVLFPTVNRKSKINVIKKAWHKDEDTVVDSDTRLLFAMNPQTDSDPIVVKIQAIQHAAMLRKERSRAAIIKLNIFDLPEEFQDAELLEEARSEEGEVYYNHVWLGEPSHKISGYPFSKIKQVQIEGGNVRILGAFLDPSFKGGDFTALSFVGLKDNQLIVWGKVWRQAWYNLIDEVSTEVKKYNPDFFWYEENALFAVPAEKFAEKGLMAQNHLTTGNKENRIYKVAAFTADRMQIVINLCNSEYIQQVVKYNEDAANDDAPDSLASCLIKCGIVPEKVKF